LSYSGNMGGPPPGYTFCAWEGERCRFGGVADVAYGASGRFAYRQGVRDGINCTNEVFGDPVFGVRKACYTRPVSGGQPDYTPPAGYTFCAWEGERCRFGGVADVAYGASGRFAYRQGVRDGINCTNEVFGDPVFGVRKACYTKPVSGGQPDYTPPAGYTFCAWEGERCRFGGVADVAYGANGRFAYRQGVRDGINCTNEVFGDPVFGVRKACYTKPVSGGSTSCSGIPINPEQRVEGRLSNTTPSVNYCLRASAGQMISLRMFALGNDGLNTYLRVWSVDGQQLDENNDGLNIGSNSFLSLRLPWDGVYRIEATRYGSTTGRYALRIEAGLQAAVGDLDRDCDVDTLDRDRLRSRLGKSDPDADLDLDGTVSTRDATFQMRNLGVRCR
jgi:hypothetical protein